MQVNVAVDRLLTCFDCDSQEVKLFFCLHQSVTITCLMTKHLLISVHCMDVQTYLFGEGQPSINVSK